MFSWQSWKVVLSAMLSPVRQHKTPLDGSPPLLIQHQHTSFNSITFLRVFSVPSYSHMSSPQHTRPHLKIGKFLLRPDSITLSIWQEQWSCRVHESEGDVLHGETDRYSTWYRVCAIKLDTVPIPFTRPSIRCSCLFEPCKLRPRVTQPVGQIRLWQGTCMPSWHQCLQHQQKKNLSTSYRSV